MLSRYFQVWDYAQRSIDESYGARCIQDRPEIECWSAGSGKLHSAAVQQSGSRSLDVKDP
jgi:hypothetical protein